MKEVNNVIQIDKSHFTISDEEKRLGFYGDNCVNSLTFEINEENDGCDYVLCILFPTRDVNMIQLEKTGANTAVWNIQREHIFSSGRIYMQLKAISSNGEIWHSPKAEAYIYSSIEEFSEPASIDTTLADRLEAAVRTINDSREVYLTRLELLKIIDELLLPLCRRLDGE